MTLWNPLNVFANDGRQKATADVSSSFDPSRIGDPIETGTARTSIGFGDSHVDESYQIGGQRRHPIGFAPSDEGAETRYRTEISFKRHHEAPQANAAGDQPGDGRHEAWATPEHGLVDPLPSSPAAGHETEQASTTTESSGEETPSEPKVPFFKRELSFRRKHDAVQGETEPAVEADADESAEAADHDADPVEAGGSTVFAAVDDSPTAGHEQQDVASEAEVVADPLSAEEPDVEDSAVNEVVPFYKREISFRRKTAVVAAGTAVTESMDEDGGVRDDHASEGGWSELEPDAPEVVVSAVAGSQDPDVDDDLAATDAATAGAGDDAVDQPSEVGSDAGEPSAPSPWADMTAASNAAADEPAEVADDADTAEADEASAGALDETEHAIAAAVVVAASEEIDDSAVAAAVDVGTDVDAPATTSRFSGGQKDTAPGKKRKAKRGGNGPRTVGLKIGASQLAAAVINQTEAGPELVELARRPLPAGIVVDGEVRDLDALANAVKAFFDEEKLPTKNVRIGLASNRIGVRTFDVVGIDDGERFDNAVRFRAHEVLPVAAHESVLDYRVLEERPNEAGEQMRRVLLVVAPRDQVEPYAEAARRAGIKLSGIDLEALALLRAFVDPKPFAARAVDDTATVVVSIGHESSTLLVAGGGACEFTRVFDWGGSALEEAIVAALDVHPAEASTILRHLSLSGPGRQYDGLDSESRASALEAVRLRLTPFARELVASLQFYQTQDESLGIGGIVVTGGTSHLEGIEDALQQMIGVNLVVGDPFARVISTGDYDPAIEAVIGSMAVPIGLAIDDLGMREVNLLPKDATASKSRRSSMTSIAVPVAVAIPLVALGFLYLGAHSKTSDAQKELDAVAAEIAALPEPQGPTLDPSISGDQAVRATAIASVLGGRLEWDAVLRDLARVLPADVWLKSLSASLPEAGNLADGTTTPVAATVPGQPAPAPTAVRIEGFTYTQPDVARLLARLATLPSLRSVTLTSSAQEKIAEKDVVHFVIVADLNQSGGAS